MPDLVSLEIRKMFRPTAELASRHAFTAPSVSARTKYF
jgi:hypothetical protein